MSITTNLGLPLMPETPPEGSTGFSLRQMINGENEDSMAQILDKIVEPNTNKAKTTDYTELPNSDNKYPSSALMRKVLEGYTAGDHIPVNYPIEPITWDGDTTGLVSIQDGVMHYAYKVSDTPFVGNALFTAESAENSNINISDSFSTVIIEPTKVADNVYRYTHTLFKTYSVFAANSTVGDLTFREVGTYFAKIYFRTSSGLTYNSWITSMSPAPTSYDSNTMSDITAEITNNKTTEITNEATDAQYPSAKAVKAYVDNKEVTLPDNLEKTDNKVTNITDESTDTQYPSAKAVKDYANSKATYLEKTANKVTSITSSATDTQYPSAKAVKAYVDANAGGGESSAAANGIPSGGATGQALVKNSNTDYDASWKTIEGGSGGTISFPVRSERTFTLDVENAEMAYTVEMALDESTTMSVGYSKISDEALMNIAQAILRMRVSKTGETYDEVFSIENGMFTQVDENYYALIEQEFSYIDIYLAEYTRSDGTVVPKGTYVATITMTEDIFGYDGKVYITDVVDLSFPSYNALTMPDTVIATEEYVDKSMNTVMDQKIAKATYPIVGSYSVSGLSYDSLDGKTVIDINEDGSAFWVYTEDVCDDILKLVTSEYMKISTTIYDDNDHRLYTIIYNDILLSKTMSASDDNQVWYLTPDIMYCHADNTVVNTIMVPKKGFYVKTTVNPTTNVIKSQIRSIEIPISKNKTLNDAYLVSTSQLEKFTKYTKIIPFSGNVSSRVNFTYKGVTYTRVSTHVFSTDAIVDATYTDNSESVTGAKWRGVHLVDVNNGAINYELYSKSESMVLARMIVCPIRITSQSSWGAPVGTIIPPGLYVCKNTDGNYVSSIIITELSDLTYMQGELRGILNRLDNIEFILNKVTSDIANSTTESGKYTFLQDGYEWNYN